jgi:hypothetical protein
MDPALPRSEEQIVVRERLRLLSLACYVPYGTLLGIATIIVISSPGARLEFQNAQAAA